MHLHHPEPTGLLSPPDSFIIAIGRDELRNNFPPQNYTFFQLLQPQSKNEARILLSRESSILK
jgi:hypothetical protein